MGRLDFNKSAWISALLGSAAMAVALTAPGAAAAQQAAEPADRIVVTAERRESFLQETPVTLSAFQAETLEERGVEDTQDIQRLVPGLKLLDNISSPTNFTVSLRGSTQQDASLVVAESPVGIYVDDIYIARLNGANAQLADIERVEVLRGPQGTLYGRNTLAGALKIITRSPGDVLDVRAMAEVGEYGHYELSGAVSGPLGDGGLSASFAALIDGFDGYYTNLATGADIGAQYNTALRGKLRYDAGGPFTAQATLSRADSENDGYMPSFAVFPPQPQVRAEDIVFGLGDPYLVNIAPNPALPDPISSLPEGDTDQTIAGLKLSYDFGWATVNSITGYVATNDFFSVEFTGVGAFPGANRSDTDQYSQEIQLLGSVMDDRLEWIAGLYLFRETADQVVALVTDDILSIETDSLAVFAQGAYALTDRLSLTAGLRWSEDEKSFSGLIRTIGGQVPIFPEVQLNNTYDAVTPRFGVDWLDRDVGPFDSLLLYASAAKGFKSGGYNGIAFGNIDVLSTPYGAEENWTYEAGVKTELLDTRLTVNAVAFQNEISDIILAASASGPGGISFPLQNAGDARVRGLEIEASARPVEGLNLYANITFQDGEYTELNPTSSAAVAEANFGEANLAQVPDIAYNVGARYSVASPVQSSGEVTVGVDHFYTDDFFINVSNEFVIDSYALTSAYAAYAFNDQWTLRATVKNIQDDAPIISGLAAFSAVTVEAPRTAFLSLSYRR
ncbi:MAG: TonB-dependent receptor [Oceanicaulis sp.]